MEQHPDLSFADDRLERAAHLRSDPSAMKAMRLDQAARVIVLWRGKPLVRETGAQGAGAAQLVRLPPDHALLAASGGMEVFLGISDSGPVFAHDLSAWEPEGQKAPEGGLFDETVTRHPALPAAFGFANLRGLISAMDATEAAVAATGKALLGWHASHGFCASCAAASQPAMAGWQRICPACGTHHFPRTDPVVIMLITKGNSVLLGRSPGWPEGMISLLAGFVEPGETLEAAVRREVMEETGVKVGKVGLLASQPWPFPASLMIGCEGRAITTEITIDPVEIEEALWITREELLRIFSGSHSRFWPARRGSIAHFLLKNWLAGRYQ